MMFIMMTNVIFRHRDRSYSRSLTLYEVCKGSLMSLNQSALLHFLE